MEMDKSSPAGVIVNCSTFDQTSHRTSIGLAELDAMLKGATKMRQFTDCIHWRVSNMFMGKARTVWTG